MRQIVNGRFNFRIARSPHGNCSLFRLGVFCTLTGAQNSECGFFIKELNTGVVWFRYRSNQKNNLESVTAPRSSPTTRYFQQRGVQFALLIAPGWALYEADFLRQDIILLYLRRFPTTNESLI